MDNPNIKIPYDKLKAFCKRWKIKTFYLFGSVLTSEFDPGESDVDIMIDFLPGSNWSLLDFVEMREELTTIFSRQVDLVTKYAIERSGNSLRKKSILDSAKVIYEQAA